MKQTSRHRTRRDTKHQMSTPGSRSKNHVAKASRHSKASRPKQSIGSTLARRARRLNTATRPATKPATKVPTAQHSKHRSSTSVATWVLKWRGVSTATAILIVVALLCVIGLVMVGSASEAISIALYGSAWSIFIREAMWMVLGFVVLMLAAKINFSKWRKFIPLIFTVSVVLLVLVLVPGIGIRVQGSSRWIGFSALRIQPSELMKLTLVLFGTDLLTRKLDAGVPERRILGPLLTASVLTGVLVLLQPDLGTTVVIGCITLALLLGSGVSIRPLVKVGACLVGIGLVAAIVSPYRRARLLSFINPSAHSSTSGYQVMQSLIGMGSGSIFGLGLGSGRQKWGYLPNAQTDFIFSVIGQELGLIGALVVLILLGILIWLGFRAALRAPDRFSALLALGLVAWIASEAIINVGAVIGLLPVTGIPLPFISYGGSSLVITMFAAGLLINIARRETLAKPKGASSGSTYRPNRERALLGSRTR